jgi:hypothetical protein
MSAEQEVKWTKGPWAVLEAFEGVAWADARTIGNSDKEFVAHTTRGWPVEMMDANARLIAAAPEMYEALKECVGRLRYDGDGHHDRGDETRAQASWDAMVRAEAALSRAEGNT